MRIRTLIVDDEPLARRRLRAFLRPEAQVEIAAECGNGADALLELDLLDLGHLAVDVRRLLALDDDRGLEGDEGEQQHREDDEDEDEDRGEPERRGPQQLTQSIHGSCTRRPGWFAAKASRSRDRSWTGAATCERR